MFLTQVFSHLGCRCSLASKMRTSTTESIGRNEKNVAVQIRLSGQVPNLGTFRFSTSTQPQKYQPQSLPQVASIFIFPYLYLLVLSTSRQVVQMKLHKYYRKCDNQVSNIKFLVNKILCFVYIYRRLLSAAYCNCYLH